MCVNACVRARACTRVPVSEQRWKGMWASAHVCVCVKYLEIQLNYITAISLYPREKRTSTQSDICVFKLVCYSRLQKRGWLVKGVSYVSGDHVRWVSVQ